MNQDTEITREQLQQLVWSKPTKTAAKEFGLSDAWRKTAHAVSHTGAEPSARGIKELGSTVSPEAIFHPDLAHAWR